MLYYSTNAAHSRVNFKTALLQGQAPDGGLYFPACIPVAPSIKNIRQYSNEAIAFAVLRPYVEGCIPDAVLKNLVARAFNFKMPLVQVTERTFALELFHGPTLAFKDVGARFLSACFNYFLQGRGQPATVLVATSGDTGGAVAAAFSGMETVNVLILYPAGRVSRIQEQQLTSQQTNVNAVAVNGSFDHCQQLVKQALADRTLRQKLLLTSANSINLGRWLPQQVYYWLALKQWKEKHPPLIAVPSGNLGNVCAGLMAQQAGMSVRHFIAACNANDAVTKYLSSGLFRSQPTVATTSSAMDVGNPNNFVRLLHLFKQNFAAIQQHLSSYSISDAVVANAIKHLYFKAQYLTDTHSAVAYCALQKQLSEKPETKGIFLATAHPVKFYDVIEPLIEDNITLPPQILALENKTKNSITLEANYEALRQLLLKL